LKRANRNFITKTDESDFYKFASKIMERASLSMLVQSSFKELNFSMEGTHFEKEPAWSYFMLRYLKHLNGEISVQSELNKGTTFSIRIPQGNPRTWLKQTTISENSPRWLPITLNTIKLQAQLHSAHSYCPRSTLRHPYSEMESVIPRELSFPFQPSACI